MSVDDCARVLASTPHEAETQSLVLGGVGALWVDGDRLASRDWFDAAYRRAESEGDVVAMAWSALGMSGLWPDEHRDGAVAVLVDTRLRRVLGGVDPGSSVGLRVRARLAGEADYRRGEHAAILAVAQEARQAGDSVAWAEAVSLAHHCLLGPEHGALRHTLARELIAESFQTARRSDLLMGLLWRTVDSFLDADRHAERYLCDLKGVLAQHGHLAVGFVVNAIEVMLAIRAGRFELAESLAQACVERGEAAGDADVVGWHGMHVLAIRWYQGRVGEVVPALRELVTSPTLSAVDNFHLAALALAAATTGDHRQAAGGLARLRAGDPAWLPRSSSWLATMYAIVEAANLLDDAVTSAAVYDLLHPFGHLPVMAGPGVACFGSAQHALGVAALTTGDAAQAVTHLRAAVRDNLSIGHWPAATLSRARLAQALAVRGSRADAAEAQRELSTATEDAAGLGMTLPAYQQRNPTARARRGNQQPLGCRRHGSKWVVEFGERTATVKDCLGMGYLATLLANPGSEISAARLAAGPGLLSLAAADSAASSHQPILDETAMRSYRQRLGDLQADVDACHASGDTAGADKAQTELDWLINELKTASGLAGRQRTFTNTDELARISVSKAIRRALQHITTADATIGQQLRDTITTGQRCSYRPNPAH